MNAVEIARLVLLILSALRQAIGAAAELSTVVQAPPDQLKELRERIAAETAFALAELDKAIEDATNAT